MDKKEQEQLIKDIVLGSAKLDSVISGGIAVYVFISKSGRRYQLDINLADKHDVGETASFAVEYPRASPLMRWVRRAVENDTIIDITSRS